VAPFLILAVPGAVLGIGRQDYMPASVKDFVYISGRETR
jgi:hypothetical protein